jgi:hypothetical protein
VLNKLYFNENEMDGLLKENRQLKKEIEEKNNLCD